MTMQVTFNIFISLHWLQVHHILIGIPDATSILNTKKWTIIFNTFFHPKFINERSQQTEDITSEVNSNVLHFE